MRKSAVPSYLASVSKIPSTTISRAGATTREPSGRPSTATSISRPTTRSSTSTRSSRSNASFRAAARSSASCTRDTPWLEPAATGLTTTGWVKEYVAAVAGVSSTPGATAMPTARGDELGRPLVHRQRARGHPGADVRHAGEVAQRRDGAVLAVRTVQCRDRHGTAAQDRDGRRERHPLPVTTPPAVAVDGQRHDVVRRGVERAGNGGRRGEGDVVLAALPAADHGDPGPHGTLRRAT